MKIFTVDLKILIIDDNHSFIDLFKMKLDQYSFHFDSSFNYHRAKELISKNQYFLPQSLSNKIEATIDRIESWKESNQPKPYPRIEKKILSLESAINSGGYFMIVVEDKTERTSQGASFIQNIIATHPDFQSGDFMLFVNNVYHEREKVAALNIPVFEKDIRNENIYQHISKKVQEASQRGSEAKDLFSKFDKLRNDLQTKIDKEKKGSKSKTSKSSKKSLESPFRNIFCIMRHPDISYEYLGRMNYKTAVSMMEHKIEEAVSESKAYWWGLEHDLVYTCGLATDKKHILVSDLSTVFSRRGGSVTVHNPGPIGFLFSFSFKNGKGRSSGLH